MSQNPLVNSNTQSSQTVLKPALTAALSSLEVQLDQELARYRRTRTGYKTLKGSSKIQPLSALSNACAPGAIAVTTGQSHPEIKINTQQAEPTKALEIISTPETQQQEQISQPSANTQIVPGNVVNGKSDAQPQTTPPEPDDYLESSEALLRSLAEEPKTDKTPTNSRHSLLSPLGIGSMLLLLLASLSLGYIAFHPKTLQLSFGWLFNRTPNNVASDDNAKEIQSNTKTVAEPQLTPIPKYPNLAKSELPEVKDPNDVVGLQPKAKPTPVNAVPPQQTPESSVAPLTTNTPAPPKPKPVVANAQIKPSSDGFYHIVTENKSEYAFAKAQKVVSDAYLSADGKLIFLGAVKNKEKAQQLLQDLQAQGIQARIHQP
ncbi:hypothetical protein [Iningainema tapete]|uniref:SPOR domain-containing protein n=1 Tax=Iningainema tapete BLCC-T55 TaxID=2748662 RepID=A0A8J7C5V5_9CYAN|nr:hypothetical protein [Iningainema tapete]MBD2771226.1 hypothetical protein [Iningainema tapete BLCC-T55]